MLTTGNQWVETAVLDFLVKFFFVFGIIGILVGLGLMFCSAKMQELFGKTNHSVSMRQPTRWLEVPHDMGPSVQRYRLGLGAVFIVAGLFGLLAPPDISRLKSIFSLNDAATIALDTLGWILLAGNALAIVTGLMLVFSPRTLSKVEEIANRWVSTRRHGLAMQRSHMTLDQLVISSPRVSGAVIALGALYIVLQVALILFKLRPGL